jgi:RNA polymerase sigma factor (sigma-70 family)
MNNKPQSINQEAVMIRHQEVIQIFQHKSDAEVWAAFNLGDERAFNYLYRLYTPILYRYGLGFCGDDNLVKDGIQNLFIYLRAKRGNLSEIRSIKAYLFRSLQNEIFRGLKGQNSSVHFDSLEHCFQIEYSPETRYIAREDEEIEQSKFNQLLSNLTRRQRQAILLLYEENLTYKEIAEVLELNDTKSARKLVYRALAALKDILIFRIKK